MTDIIFIVLAFVIGTTVGFINGNVQGKIDQCNTLQSEYYNGKCVKVERKEIKL